MAGGIENKPYMCMEKDVKILHLLGLVITIIIMEHLLIYLTWVAITTCTKFYSIG